MKKIIAGIVMTFALVGCGAPAGEVEPVDTEKGPAPQQVEPAFEVGLSEVYYIQYSDGTRCVVVDRDNGGAGVDCDWSQ